MAPDLADAAVAAHTVGQARKLLIRLPGLARQLPSEMMTTADAYTSAVLATDDDAERLHESALASLAPGCRLIRARLHLHRGRRLRGLQQYVDARELLRAARDEFDRLGARPWAETARTELRATGEASSSRNPAISEQLSPQQMQIAVMASQGLNNEEIADRLFISHRTVATHLNHIYPRLGVTSPAQLAGALAAAAPRKQRP